MKAAEKAYQELRSSIIDGSHPPGSRIIEQEVAAAAGVSRTPVREALRRLEAEGLLRFVPNQGAFVRSWNAQDVEDIFELRAMLEGYAARLAARSASDAQVAELQSLAEQQRDAARRRSRGWLNRVADLNARFHDLLQEAAQSERLAATLATLSNLPLVLQTFRDYQDEDLERSAHHHLELVEAIKARDPVWAESVMHAHVMAARRVFRTLHSNGKD
ncbi:MAG: GntR family transcriptional regulator [Xanthomonadales bacterium]|nr:GntR family transcriptional regulator [Xanthomonadales bacterium]